MDINCVCNIRINVITQIIGRSTSTLPSGWSTGRCLGLSLTTNKASLSRCLPFRLASSLLSPSCPNIIISNYLFLVNFASLGYNTSCDYKKIGKKTILWNLKKKLTNIPFQFINFYASLIYIAFFKVIYVFA